MTLADTFNNDLVTVGPHHHDDGSETCGSEVLLNAAHVVEQFASVVSVGCILASESSRIDSRSTTKGVNLKPGVISNRRVPTCITYGDGLEPSISGERVSVFNHFPERCWPWLHLGNTGQQLFNFSDLVRVC